MIKHIVFLVTFSLILIQCRKEEVPIAEVSVEDISYLTQNSLVTSILIDKIKPGEIFMELGICWSSMQKPTTEDDHVGLNQLPLDFQTIYDLPLSGLKAGSQYYLRPYATTQEEIVYGEEIVINTLTLDSLVDPRDGQGYLIRQYGSQTWMVENLNYRAESSWYFDNDSAANAEEHGRLYTYEAALEACPPGWHLPTDEEWKELEIFLGMPVDSADYNWWRGETVGSCMKEPGFRLWQDVSNTTSTNSSGFTVKPSGILDVNTMTFNQSGTLGEYWTSTQEGEDAWIRACWALNGKVLRTTMNRTDYAFSVRCIKD